MIVFYYDIGKYDLEGIQNTFNWIKSNVNEEVIAIPKDFDILLDCSTDQLLYIKTRIEKAISEKEQINDM